MTIFYKKKYIKGLKDLTEFNTQMLSPRKSNERLKEAFMFVDQMANYLWLKEDVIERTKYVITELWPNYRHFFNTLRYENVCLAIIFLASEDCRIPFEIDRVHIIEDLYKERDRDKMLDQLNRAAMRLEELY